MGKAASWQPIARGKPEIVGVHPQHSGLLRVRIALCPRPDSEWSRFFLSPTGVSMSLSMHAPSLAGSTIQLTPPDNEFDGYVQHVDERISAANAYYARGLPRLSARQTAEAQAATELQERLDAARQRATDL